MLQEEIVKLQCYDRKDNLKFVGISERAYETNIDCRRVILNILASSNIRLHPKVIQSAYRIGPKTKNRERSIVIKMFHAREKELVLAQSQHKWSCTRIRIEEAFPPAIEAQRKILKPILIAANQKKDQNGQTYRTSMRLNKLNVNGNIYTTKTMNKLQTSLDPEKIATPTNGKVTAFFTTSSPLSNHHIANQEVEGVEFNCNEQYYVYKKAKTCKHHDSAAQIMKERDPAKQKSLGRDENISNFKKSTWRERCNDIMQIGLKSKFDQNSRLKVSNEHSHNHSNRGQSR